MAGATPGSKTQVKSETSSFTGSEVTDTSASALHQLLSPDGYYTYLNIEKPFPGVSSSFIAKPDPATEKEDGNKSNEIDVEKVKKNYRRLSLRHHPDRRGGDAETFRVLNRAKRVLTNPKLRKQYDMLGLDLEDDNEDNQGGENKKNSEGGEDGTASTDEDGSKNDGDGSAGANDSESVMSHLASATIAAILQMAIRTAMMALISTFISRYKLTLIPAAAFLGFTSYRIYSTAKAVPGSAGTSEIASPLLIAAGIYLMYLGRDSAADMHWSWTFWLGEVMVMTMFINNSIPNKSVGFMAALIGFFILSTIISLLLRGKIWRYASMIAIELLFAFVAVLVFPVMEMILTEIINEKLRKVGEKVRSHYKRMEEMRKKAEKDSID